MVRRGRSPEKLGFDKTLAEESFLFQESQGLRQHSLCTNALETNAATIAAWAHMLLPYLPLLAWASTINCSTVSFGNLETVLRIYDNHLAGTNVLLEVRREKRKAT